jgi:hypothetical protein
MSEQPIVVELEITPGILRALRRRGFLTSGETPDGVVAAVFGVLAKAFGDSEFRATPEPAPEPPMAVAAPPPASAPPPAAPQRPKTAKASPPPANVEELRDGADVPAAPPVRQPSTNAADAAAERRAAYFKRLAAATEARPPAAGSTFSGE